jgi:hypothetical protein
VNVITLGGYTVQFCMRHIVGDPAAIPYSCSFVHLYIYSIDILFY